MYGWTKGEKHLVKDLEEIIASRLNGFNVTAIEFGCFC